MATVKGTWRFNDVLNGFSNDSLLVNVNFITVYMGKEIECVRLDIFTNHGDLYLLGFTTAAPLEGGGSEGIMYYWGEWMSYASQIVTFSMEQEVSDEFYEWFTANATPQAKTKVFKKLYVGDVVATSGTKVFKKLTTEEPAKVLDAGLYDENDNLLKDWKTLNLNIEKDYEKIDNYYSGSLTRPYYALKNINYCKLVIPDGVTKIGDRAFLSCSTLKSISIPDSVQTIGYAAFNGSNLSDGVKMPQSMEDIGAAAFGSCSLASIEIPIGVPEIDKGTFLYSSKLTSIIIPNSVTRIATNAFDDCTNLTDIFYRGTQEQWNAIGTISANSMPDAFKPKPTIHYNYTG